MYIRDVRPSRGLFPVACYRLLTLVEVCPAHMEEKLHGAEVWLRERGLHCQLAYNTQVRYFVPSTLKCKRKDHLPRVSSFWDFLRGQGWRVSMACNHSATALHEPR